MAERKTILKVLGIVVLVGLVFVLVVGFLGRSGGSSADLGNSAGQQAKQTSSLGPKVLFFHADY